MAFEKNPNTLLSIPVGLNYQWPYRVADYAISNGITLDKGNLIIGDKTIALPELDLTSLIKTLVRWHHLENGDTKTDTSPLEKARLSLLWEQVNTFNTPDKLPITAYQPYLEEKYNISRPTVSDETEPINGWKYYASFSLTRGTKCVTSYGSTVSTGLRFKITRRESDAMLASEEEVDALFEAAKEELGL